MQIIDSLHFQYGYLNEDVIGLFPQTDSISRENSPYSIILIHCCKNRPEFYGEWLSKEALAGRMNNLELMSHSKNFAADQKFHFHLLNEGGADYWLIGDYVFTGGPDLVKKVNINRAVYHMPPISHTYRSMMYYQFHNTAFRIGVGLARRTYPTKEAELNGIDKAFSDGFITLDRP
jgi:hypothetical protein